MLSCNHATFAVSVSVVTIALIGLWTSIAEAKSLAVQLNVVKEFEDDLQFIKTMMFADRFWWPVLKGTVQFEVSQDIDPLDHYSEKALDADQSSGTIIVEPFVKAMQIMMISNSSDPTFIGSQVEFVMTTTKYALRCSVFRHLSLQGFLVYHLLSKKSQRWGAILKIVKWLEQMTRLSIDKLAAVDMMQTEVADLHYYTRQLLTVMESERGDSPAHIKQIEKISKDMYEILKFNCVEGNGTKPVYGILVTDLKRSMEPGSLKEFEMMMINERLKGVPEMDDIKDMLTYKGPLQIDVDVMPSHLAELDPNELKKIITVNRIRMMFVYLNLPVNTLGDKQWASLYQREPMHVVSVQNLLSSSRG